MTNSGCHAPIGACPVGQVMGARGCVPVFNPTPVYPVPVNPGRPPFGTIPGGGLKPINPGLPVFPYKPPVFNNPGVGIINRPPLGPSGPVYTPPKFPVLNLPPRPANNPPFVLSPGGGGNNLGSNNPKPVGAAPFRAPPSAIFHPFPGIQGNSPLIH